MSQIEVLGPVA